MVSTFWKNVIFSNQTSVVTKNNEEFKFTFFEGEHKNFGQEAFDRYALEIGDPVMDGGMFTHGTGYEWQAVFEKAFEGDPESGSIDYDCEVGGFFCYAKSLSVLEDLGARFRAVCMDEEKFTELVSTALKEREEKERQDEEMRHTLRGVFAERPQNIIDVMTPDGFLQLTADQRQQLLSGELKTVIIGDLEVDAEYLLDQKIANVNYDFWGNGNYQIQTKLPE